MITYERVTYRDGGTGPRRHVFLENPRPIKVFGDLDALAGRHVNREGQVIHDLFIVTLAEIEKRQPYEMDFHYGWLVPEGRAKS